MAITDNKTFGWNINWQQAVGLLAILVIVFLAIYTNSLVIGYTVMSLVLCAFFVVVAFDVGLPGSGRTAPAEPVDDDARAPR
jgi:hypothetical protein